MEVEPGALKRVVGPAIGEVAAAMGRAGVGLAGPPFARYLDWHPERVVVEVGFPVIRPAPAVGRVEPATLPGGTVASAVHVGPYETLGETYNRLQAWMAEHGRTRPRTCGRSTGATRRPSTTPRRGGRRSSGRSPTAAPARRGTAPPAACGPPPYRQSDSTGARPRGAVRPRTARGRRR